MKNESNEAEMVEVPGKGRSSRLAMRIRRAAQLASRAKAKTAGEQRVHAPGSEAEASDKPKKAASPRPSSKGPSVGTASVFHRYLRSLHAAEVLPSEEEKRLALLYQANKDSDAAGRLVRGNLRLVVKIAEEYSRNEDQLMDLIQEGNLGLLHALEKFDPNRGVKLSSYAAWWVRAYILRFVLGNFRIVRLGTTLAQRKLFYRLRRERERLERKGVEADVNQLADALQVRPSDVSEMELRLASPEVSLDATPRNDRPHATSNVVPADPGGPPGPAAGEERVPPPPQELRRAVQRGPVGPRAADLLRPPHQRPPLDPARAGPPLRREPRARPPARVAAQGEDPRLSRDRSSPTPGSWRKRPDRRSQGRRAHADRRGQPAPRERSAQDVRRDRAGPVLPDRGAGPAGARGDAVRERRLADGARLVPGSDESLRLDPACMDPLASHYVMLEEVVKRAPEFDVIHYHVDYLHFPFSRGTRPPT